MLLWMMWLGNIFGRNIADRFPRRSQLPYCYRDGAIKVVKMTMVHLSPAAHDWAIVAVDIPPLVVPGACG